MADVADSTPASSGQFALTIADLNSTVNHEPRGVHRKLASALGSAAPHKLAHLIARHREALERLGEVSSTVDETSRQGGRCDALSHLEPGLVDGRTRRGAAADVSAAKLRRQGVDRGDTEASAADAASRAAFVPVPGGWT